MKQYQIDSLVSQIVSHIDHLSLPLSDRECIIVSDSRKALRDDIIVYIEYLYDRSLIDSLQKDEFFISLSCAYTLGGL